jgi:hypothetical protein
MTGATGSSTVGARRDGRPARSAVSCRVNRDGRPRVAADGGRHFAPGAVATARGTGQPTEYRTEHGHDNQAPQPTEHARTLPFPRSSQRGPEPIDGRWASPEGAVTTQSNRALTNVRPGSVGPDLRGPEVRYGAVDRPLTRRWAGRTMRRQVSKRLRCRVVSWSLAESLGENHTCTGLKHREHADGSRLPSVILLSLRARVPVLGLRVVYRLSRWDGARPIGPSPPGQGDHLDRSCEGRRAGRNSPSTGSPDAGCPPAPRGGRRRGPGGLSLQGLSPPPGKRLSVSSATSRRGSTRRPRSRPRTAR